MAPFHQDYKQSPGIVLKVRDTRFTMLRKVEKQRRLNPNAAAYQNLDVTYPFVTAVCVGSNWDGRSDFLNYLQSAWKQRLEQIIFQSYKATEHLFCCLWRCMQGEYCSCHLVFFFDRVKLSTQLRRRGIDFLIPSYDSSPIWRGWHRDSCSPKSRRLCSDRCFKTSIFSKSTRVVILRVCVRNYDHLCNTCRPSAVVPDPFIIFVKRDWQKSASKSEINF